MAISDRVFSSFDQCFTLSRANWIVYSEDPKGAPRYGRPELVTLIFLPAKAAVAGKTGVLPGLGRIGKVTKALA